MPIMKKPDEETTGGDLTNAERLTAIKTKNAQRLKDLKVQKKEQREKHTRQWEAKWGTRSAAADNSNIHPDFGSVGSTTGKM
jgi:hypothetical protein